MQQQGPRPLDIQPTIREPSGGEGGLSGTPTEGSPGVGGSPSVSEGGASRVVRSSGEEPVGTGGVVQTEGGGAAPHGATSMRQEEGDAGPQQRGYHGGGTPIGTYVGTSAPATPRLPSGNTTSQPPPAPRPPPAAAAAAASAALLGQHAVDRGHDEAHGVLPATIPPPAIPGDTHQAAVPTNDDDDNPSNDEPTNTNVISGDTPTHPPQGSRVTVLDTPDTHTPPSPVGNAPAAGEHHPTSSPDPNPPTIPDTPRTLRASTTTTVPTAPAQQAPVPLRGSLEGSSGQPTTSTVSRPSLDASRGGLGGATDTTGEYTTEDTCMWCCVCVVDTCRYCCVLGACCMDHTHPPPLSHPPNPSPPHPLAHPTAYADRTHGSSLDSSINLGFRQASVGSSMPRQPSLDSSRLTGSTTTSTEGRPQLETWLVMEFCDRGNLYKALREHVLHDATTGSVYMVWLLG